MEEIYAGKEGRKGEGVRERERGGNEGKREKDWEFNLLCSKKRTEKVKLKLPDFLL